MFVWFLIVDLNHSLEFSVYKISYQLLIWLFMGGREHIIKYCGLFWNILKSRFRQPFKWYKNIAVDYFVIITLLLVTLKAVGYVLLQIEKVEFKGKNNSMLNASLALKVCCQNWPMMAFGVDRVRSPQTWSHCLICVYLDYVKFYACFHSLQSTSKFVMSWFSKIC